MSAAEAPPGDPHDRGDAEATLERTILELLGARAPGATICPSDAARAVGDDDWRSLMEPTRQAARQLVARGEVVITQSGQVVDPDAARGPIRIRLVGRCDATPPA